MHPFESCAKEPRSAFTGIFRRITSNFVPRVRTNVYGENNKTFT